MSEELERMRAAFLLFIEQAITVSSDNTPEWMDGFAENVNAAAEAIGEKDRVRIKKRAHRCLPLAFEIIRHEE